MERKAPRRGPGHPREGVEGGEGRGPKLYNLQFSSTGAVRHLANLERRRFTQLINRLAELRLDPFPHDCEQLKGFRDPDPIIARVACNDRPAGFDAPLPCKGLLRAGGRGRNGYRIDVGDYRVLYAVDTSRREAGIFVVEQRGSAYR